MRLFAALTTALCLASPVTVLAQQHQQSAREPVVVELFTSQGCSSCPPADALLKKLAGRPDVLALALHVDYWDYIGWKDTFANPAYTRRQKGYAHVGGRKMIYTPQMIVMGHRDVSGADAMGITDAIASHQTDPRPVALEIQRNGEQLSLSISPRVSLPQIPVSIHLVRYSPLQTVQITRGELTGHSIEYANIVQDLQQVGTWDGQDALEMVIDLPDARQDALTGDLTGSTLAEQQTAVLIQQAPFGPILAAAWVE